jgi:hypothetical protein
MPDNHNTPADYVYYSGDILFNNTRPSDPPSGVIITNEIGGHKCGPNSLAYVYRLFKNHSGRDEKISPDFYTKEFEDGRYTDTKGDVLKDVGLRGIKPADFKHYVCNPDGHFKVNNELSNSISNTPLKAQALYNVLKQNVDPDNPKKHAVITVIPFGGIEHIIVIIGYRGNGNVIYMDPVQKRLQIVWACPSFIRLDKCAIVIEGIK